MKRILFILSQIMFALTATAQTEVTSYQPGVTTDGITYFLPSTALRIVVTATRTHYTPGEYCNYAERYLRLKDVPLTEYDTWTINDVAVYTYGTPDKTKAYSIKLKQKTSAPLATLTPDGRLIAVNDKVNYTEEKLPTPSVTKIEGKTINGADFKTEEILSAGSSAKMAELTANEIYDIRENRGLLTKGQADFMPKDGEQLKLMLANLDTQEEGLLQLFKGSNYSETHVFTYDVTPQSDLAKHVLCNFSKHLGMVDTDDPAGSPIYLSVTNEQSLSTPQEETNNSKSKKEAEGIRYIVPNQAKVTVFSESKTYLTKTLPFAQFGKVENLGGELFNKRNTTHVQLSPVTGNIAKIEAEKPE